MLATVPELTRRRGGQCTVWHPRTSERPGAHWIRVPEEAEMAVKNRKPDRSPWPGRRWPLRRLARRHRFPIAAAPLPRPSQQRFARLPDRIHRPRRAQGKPRGPELCHPGGHRLAGIQERGHMVPQVRCRIRRRPAVILSPLNGPLAHFPTEVSRLLTGRALLCRPLSGVLVSGVEHKRLPQLMPMCAAARPSILA
jgi:hypothetical protein